MTSLYLFQQEAIHKICQSKVKKLKKKINEDNYFYWQRKKENKLSNLGDMYLDISKV